ADGRPRPLRDPAGAPRLPRHDPRDRAGEDRSSVGRDRRDRRVPVGHPQAPRGERHPRAAVRGGVRRDRHRHAHAPDGRRGDREGRRLVRADPHGPGARHAADPALRHRGAEAALAAEVRDRRVVAGVRAVRARGRQRPGLDAHARQARRGHRRVGHQRREELDHQRGHRRLLRRLRDDRSRFAPHHRIHRREGPTGLLDRQPRAQARDQGLAHGLAGLRGRPRPGGEHHRRGRQGPAGRARDARAHAARRRRAGGRHRAGRDRLRRRLRARAHHLRQADRRAPGHRLQARRHGDGHRRRARAALQGVRDGRPRRAEPGQVHVDGQALRLGQRDAGDDRGDPGARRLRVRQGVSGRAVHARREDHPDLRGRQRDPAARHRQDDEV
ncbi:MAG: Acyl-CoA dehydrogenase, short-chain specific, partial [uncultured Solirubrobacteraceae bacterium]